MIDEPRMVMFIGGPWHGHQAVLEAGKTSLVVPEVHPEDRDLVGQPARWREVHYSATELQLGGGVGPRERQRIGCDRHGVLTLMVVRQCP